MNEAIFFALADVDERGINAGQHILDSAEINIANLVATLGNNQFINAFIGENCGDPQLLGNDDLLGHGKVGWLKKPC